MRLPFSNLQYRHWNPGATAPLVIPVSVVCNVPEDIIDANIRANSLLPNAWLYNQPAHDRVALICGGGPSLRDCIGDVRDKAGAGGDILALNGAAAYLASRLDRVPDYQIILDAQRATADLIGPARKHLFASQVDPECFARVPEAVLWHLQVDGIDDLLPANHRDRDYTLIGAACSVGTTALVVAYTLGYRRMHVYGVDSSHRGDTAHAFHQPMNDGEPRASVRFNGKDYITSLTMKLQAERFPLIARLLQREGCEIHVHGDGLLPDIWNTPPEALSEREKYLLMWCEPDYRRDSPGARVVPMFLEIVQPSEGATVLDLGCGTGRASLRMHDAGLSPVMLDFAGNCRDEFAEFLPFYEHDLSEPILLRADYGFCADVMEHIPAEQTDAVLANIFAACPRVFFSIGTEHDNMGLLINQTLHVNVADHGQWRERLASHGTILFEDEREGASIFYVERKA